MKRSLQGLLVLIVSAFVASLTLAQGETVTIHEKLKPLQPFIGKTYRGVFKNPKGNKPMIDVMRYERALNGQAIRVLHSVNDGEYGGESIIFWDTTQKQVVYYYFTTAGFFTHGAYTVEGNKFIAQEYVTGSTTDITQVKSISELSPDGKIKMTSSYLKGDVWEPGHEILYEESATSQVIFR